jgi:hypothetical protein
VAITAPGPRPPHRLRDMATAGWRYHANLGLWPVLRRYVRRMADLRFVASLGIRLDVSAENDPALGPRSLPPPLFLERCA